MVEVRNNRKHFLILGVAFLIQWALLLIVRTPTWDATFYYSYVRSIVFDGDLKIDNDLQLSYPTTSADFAAKRLDTERTETGRVASPFAIGSSLLWLPWMIVLRVGALLGQVFGWLPATLNGYEWYFTAGLATLSMFLGWIAFLLGHQIARAQSGGFSALAATLTLLFATPLLYYQYREPLYSHAASAFVTALVVYFWWRIYKKAPSSAESLALGALIGLAALVRWQHLVYLVLLAVSLSWWWLELSGENRRRQWRKPVISLGLMAIAALLVLSIQFFHWRLIYGTWLTIPQGSAYVDWQAPNWLPVLISPFRGLATWMPAIILSVIGLILLARKNPRLAIPMLLVLGLETYVNSSTLDWFGGAGFGPRRYTSELVILIVGYAAFLRFLPGIARKPITITLGLVLLLHQWILLRYGLVEQIGGRNLSMYPSYEWVETSQGEFWRALVVHLSDLLRRPRTFFVFHGSPLDKLLAGKIPVQQLFAIVATAAFVFVAWRVARSATTKLQRINVAYRRVGVILVITLSIVVFNLWIWLFA